MLVWRDSLISDALAHFNASKTAEGQKWKSQLGMGA
jgi:hypothetical protein